MPTLLQQELTRRLADGRPPKSRAAIQAFLRSHGYTLRPLHCYASTSRMCGRGVDRYPCTDLPIADITTGRSIWHHLGRRDEAFEQVKRAVHSGAYYYAARGATHSL